MCGSDASACTAVSQIKSAFPRTVYHSRRLTFDHDNPVDRFAFFVLFVSLTWMMNDGMGDYKADLTPDIAGDWSVDVSYQGPAKLKVPVSVSKVRCAVLLHPVQKNPIAHFPARLDPASILLHRQRHLPIVQIQSQLQHP
jgi:hypothetical protein